MAIFANCKQVVMRFIFLFISLFIFGFIYATNPDQVFGQNYELYEQAGKKGLKNDEGKIIIPAEYQEIGWSHSPFQISNELVGYKENGLWGLINLDNEQLTQAIYTQINPTGSQLFVVGKNLSTGEFLGCINKKGALILPFKYVDIKVADDRFVVGKKNSKGFVYSLLTASGDEILGSIYKDIDYLGDSKFLAKNLQDELRLVNKDGEAITNISFDSLSSFQGNHAIIYDDHLRGIISQSGEVVLEPQHQSITLKNDYAKVQPLHQWSVLSANNLVLDEIATQNLRLFSGNYYQAETNNLSQLINHNVEGAFVAMLFNKLKGLTNNLAIFSKGNQSGVVNGNGEIKLPPKFDSLFIEGNIIIGNRGGTWAVYDSFNVKKTDELYQEILPATARLFKVKKNNHWGLINRYGEEIVDCVFDDIYAIQDDQIVVSFHKEKGVINTSGEWVVLPRKANSIQLINEEYFIEEVGKLKRLNHVTDGIIYFTENQIDIFDGYLLEYTSDGGIWKIDFSGQIVEQARDESYEEVRPPSEGFYAIKKDGKYGFIDAQNRLRIANRYDEVGDFSQGLAGFKLIGKWGFLNKKEEIVIQPLYEKVSQFYGNVAIAYTQNGAGLIDQIGNQITSFNYDSLDRQSNNRFIAYKDGKKGLLTSEGKLLINARYDYIEDLRNGYFIVGKSEKFGLVDTFGVNTIPMIYDEIIYDHNNDRYLGLKKSATEKVELR